VFLSSGKFDPIIDAENAAALAEMLRKAGADVTHKLLPSGHELTRVDIDDAREWLARFS